MLLNKRQIGEVVDSSFDLNITFMFLPFVFLLSSITLFILGFMYSDILKIIIAIFFLVFVFFWLIRFHQVSIHGSDIFIYKYNFLYRIGNKYLLSDFKDVIMTLETSSYQASLPMGPVVSWYGTSSKHYEIFLVKRNGERILLRELNEFNEAVNYQKTMAKKLGLNYVESNLFSKSKQKGRRR